MAMVDVIRDKITAALSPVAVEVTDESARHHGHSGARPGGETHFNVRIVSAAFSGKNRLERQRMVYAALAEEMKTQIHALAITTVAPGEE